MFNLHELPTSVLLDGVVYGLDMSFDNIIRMHELFMSDEDETVKLYNAIQLLFVDELDYEPEQQVKAFETVYSELIATKEQEVVQYDLKGNPMPTTKSDDDDGAEYCIVRDMQYIYPSFLQDYSIDLLKERGKMHWWTFKALLSGLSADTKFKQVLDIRSRDLTGLKGKELEQLRDAKKYYALKPYGKAVQNERN